MVANFHNHKIYGTLESKVPSQLWLLGPFEEEEEGTGIASDVVKVMGEDPATPGLLPKGIDPGTVTIPQYRVNKTKQH